MEWRATLWHENIERSIGRSRIRLPRIDDSWRELPDRLFWDVCLMTMFSDDFKETPYWWEDWSPKNASYRTALPNRASVAIVGAGYAGLSCALEFLHAGIDVVVLEADAPGIGASTLSGGQVSGGVNVGKSPTGKPLAPEREQALLTEASVSYDVFERLLRDNAIDCDYVQAGRVNAFWTASQREAWVTRIEKLNRYAKARASLLDGDAIRKELGTSFYPGGVLIERAGQVHPAKLLSGLLQAVEVRGGRVCGEAAVTHVSRRGSGYLVKTARGDVIADTVIYCTNGYTRKVTPDLQRRIVPVVSHQIATEPLPPALRETLLPRRRAVAETRRVVNYYRFSPDGTRLLFGGRARFYEVDRRQSGAVLHRQLLDRFPQLSGVKVSHSWGGSVGLTLDFLPHIGQRDDGTYFAVGCNGSGVVMMTYLGHKLARLLIEKMSLDASAYGRPMLTHPLYRGKPWFMPAMGTYYQVRDSLDRRK